MSDIGSIVGIDLGTTMSVISHLDSSYVAASIPNREGEPLTPSAIYVDGSNVIVGKAAKDAASHYPEKVATLVKRDIGQAAYSKTVDGKTYRPETLSAIILQKLKQDAERRIGKISQAVITVPAFFDDARRKATRDAGVIAGLDVLDIVNEPTAAAMTFALNGRLGASASGSVDAPRESMTAVVYDLGGGTFDVTVVKLNNKDLKTLATDGEVQLGGRDWDEKIIDYVGEAFQEQFGVNPNKDPGRRATIANMAETAKKLLSQLPSAPIECFHDGNQLQTSLSRDKFEELTEDLLERSEMVTHLVIKQAALTWAEIDRVLLVGGSTRIPAVAKMLKRVTGIDPDDSLDPDQVVSHGAAIFGAVLAAKQHDGDLVIADDLEEELAGVVVQDVNAHSLGVGALHKGKVTNAKIIPKNTQLPYASSKVLHLAQANKRSVAVKVLEGEAPLAEDCTLMGVCQVQDLAPGLPKFSPVQVRLGFETNGLVTVDALEMTGGSYANAEFRREDGLSDAEIEREKQFVESLSIQ